MTSAEERSRWKICADRVVDQNPHLRLSVATLELPDGTVFDQYDANETEAVRWIPLTELPGLIADGVITGAATIIGAQHALSPLRTATGQQRALAGPRATQVLVVTDPRNPHAAGPVRDRDRADGTAQAPAAVTTAC